MHCGNQPSEWRIFHSALRDVIPVSAGPLHCHVHRTTDGTHSPRVAVLPDDRRGARSDIHRRQQPQPVEDVLWSTTFAALVSCRVARRRLQWRRAVVAPSRRLVKKWRRSDKRSNGLKAQLGSQQRNRSLPKLFIVRSLMNVMQRLSRAWQRERAVRFVRGITSIDLNLNKPLASRYTG
jgi:hypothetical protein